MNKTFKISLVVVAMLAVVLFAQSGAWAGKLQSSNQAPSVAVNETGMRPLGTTTGRSAGLVTYGVGMSGILHQHMVGAANIGRPDGTYYVFSGNASKAVTVKIDVGPNWHGQVYYFNGSGWQVNGFQRNNDVLMVTFPAGAMYFAVTPANGG